MPSDIEKVWEVVVFATVNGKNNNEYLEDTLKTLIKRIASMTPDETRADAPTLPKGHYGNLPPVEQALLDVIRQLFSQLNRMKVPEPKKE